MTIRLRTVVYGVIGLLVFAIAFAGFIQTTHALTQADVDLICVILDCDEAGIRDALEALVDDEAKEITKSLFRGISDDDVTILQELLAEDPTIYPEGLVTGFFGPLTEQAVLRFQERFGIDTVGVVGPITRGTLNKLLKNKSKGMKLTDVFENDSEDEDESDDGDNDNTGKNVKVCHAPPGNPANAKTISIGAPAVQAHLAHGDSVGECSEEADDEDEEEEEEEETTEEDAQDAIDDAQEAIDEAQEAIDGAEDGEEKDNAQELLDDANTKLDEAQTAFDDEDYDEAEDLAEEAEDLADDALEELGDITGPEISDIEVEVASDSAEVTWTTDEASDSTVWYSTSSPVDTDTDDSESDSDDVTDHSVLLTGLSASTTYYFIVGSEDPDGNETMSSEDSFTTTE